MSLKYIPSYSEIRTYIANELNYTSEVKIENTLLYHHVDARKLAQDLRLHCRFDDIQHAYYFQEGVYNVATQKVIH